MQRTPDAQHANRADASLPPLTPAQRAFLESVAHLVWWKEPQKALEWPEYLLRQVMCLGSLEESIALEALFPKADLRKVLLGAEAGQLNGRSWNFWYARLFDCISYDQIAPCPVRQGRMTA